MQRSENAELSPRVVECIDCGEQFVISPGERKFYLENLLKEPCHCFDCRAKRRLQRAGIKTPGGDRR